MSKGPEASHRRELRSGRGGVSVAQQLCHSRRPQSGRSGIWELPSQFVGTLDSLSDLWSAGNDKKPRTLRLEKALRVDVDRNADAAARFGRCGQHGAQESLQIGGPGRLGGEAETMAFAHDRDWRLGRAEQDDFVFLALPAERRDAPVFCPRQSMSGSRQHPRVRFRGAAILGRDDDRRKAAERRQAAEPPLLGLLSVEPLGVTGHKRRDHRMVRLPCLQKRVAGFVAASRASRRLAKKLERALGRARIGVGETHVGVDYADKGQKREVMPLGDQLRADDEVVGAARRCIELSAQSVEPTRRIR